MTGQPSGSELLVLPDVEARRRAALAGSTSRPDMARSFLAAPQQAAPSRGQFAAQMPVFEVVELRVGESCHVRKLLHKRAWSGVVPPG